MDLADRLLPNTRAEREARIEIHAFGAAMREFARGEVTEVQLRAGLGINVGDETTQLTAVLAAITAAPNTAGKLSKALEVEDVVLLSGAGVAYAGKAAIRTRLGL